MATPAPARTSPRLFYGWIVVAIAFVTMATAISARTSYSLLLPEIIKEFGWSSGLASGAFAIGFAASTAFLPLIGVLMDRFGPRLVVPMGAVLVASGLAAAPLIASPLVLYLTLGLLLVAGSMALSYVGHSMFLPNWFVRNRGLAIGIAFSGVGVGAIVLLPVMQILIDDHGWRTACLAMAALIVVAIVPLNVLFQRKRPQDIGLEPDGDPPDAPHAEGAPPPRRPPDPVVDRAWAAIAWTPSNAVRTARFWFVFFGYFCALFVWYALQVHQTKFLIEAGFDARLAATALGLVAFFGIFGQIALGAFSDRAGREIGWTLAMLGFAAASALILLVKDHPSTGLLYAMVMMQGLFGYGLASMFGAIPAEIFAGPRFAGILALISLGGNFGAGAGAWLVGVLYDVTGGYTVGYALCVVASFLSIGFIWLAAPRRVRLVAGQAKRLAAASEAA